MDAHDSSNSPSHDESGYFDVVDVRFMKRLNLYDRQWLSTLATICSIPFPRQNSDMPLRLESKTNFTLDKAVSYVRWDLLDLTRRPSHLFPVEAAHRSTVFSLIRSAVVMPLIFQPTSLPRMIHVLRRGTWCEHVPLLTLHDYSSLILVGDS